MNHTEQAVAISYHQSRRSNLSSLMAITALSALITAHAQETRKFSLEDARNNAVWATTRLDLTVDVSQSIPRFSGEITLELAGDASSGPMLLLDNRDVSTAGLEWVEPLRPNRTISRVRISAN